MYRRFMLYLCLLALPGFFAAAQAASQPIFEPGPCPVSLSAGTEIECGMVTVPQDRAHMDERDVRLAVAVFKARSGQPAPDPLIFLDGGPGARTLDSMAGGLGVFLTALNQDRDVIIFDYRGIGYSDPSLTCPESIGVQDLSWVPECRARFAALGVDVTDYTTRDNAADAADIIRALGYDSYNVWGGSDGSSVAMTLLRDHPEHVRAAIVTALQPPQGDLQSMTVPYVLRTLDEVSALCQADAACAAAFPQDLTAQVLEVIERLNASPITVDANGVQGELKGIQVLAVLSEMLKDETNFPIVPSFIATLAAGNYDAVVPYVNVLEPPADPLNPYGAWLSMRCTDSILVPSSDMIEEALQGLSPSVRGSFMDVHQGQRALCEAWGARVPTAADRLPAEADTPVLIISGALDPFSSQEWLASALETLPNGYGYMLPYHAHFVIHNPCASRLLIGFIDDPQQEPDANCMANIPSPTFQGP